MHTVSSTGKFILFWLLCPLIAIASWRFMVGGVAETMDGFLYQAQLRPLIFYTHVVLAPVALFLVPFQLWSRLRVTRPRLHRILGRVYGISIILSGSAGFLWALTTQSGTVAAWGFACLAVAWVTTTVHGILRAMNKDPLAHRRWMIRSVALTLSAVTLRIYLGAFAVAGYPYEDIVGIIAWLCWIPNLIAAEFIIRVGHRSRASNPFAQTKA